MIRHYLKVAIRNLAKYKTQTVISVITIGLSVTLFSIVSSFLLRVTGDRLLQQDYVHNAAIAYYFANDNGIDNPGSYQRFGIFDISSVEGHQFKTIDRIFLPDSKPVSVIIVDDDSNVHKIKSQKVDYDFLKWCAYESAVTHATVKEMKDNEVIITESLANKIFGDANKALGRQISVQYPESDNAETRQYIVADVLSPVSIGDDKLKGAALYHCDNIAADDKYTFAYLSIRDGFKLSDVAEELCTIMNIPGTNMNIWRYKEWNGKNMTMGMIVSRTVIFFMYLFVIVTLSSAMRHWLQLFNMRYREIAIRKSQGSRTIGILSMIFSEESISIIGAIIVSLLCNHLAINFITSNFAMLDLDSYLTKVYPLTLFCYLSIFIICMIVDLYAVKRMSYGRNGLALQMRPSKHRLRNAGICFQIILSILFLSVTAVLIMEFNNIEKSFGIPADADRYYKSLHVCAENITPTLNTRLNEELKNITSAEHIMNADYELIPVELADSTNLIIKLYSQNKDEIINFFKMPVHYTADDTELQRYVLVDQSVMDKMTAAGDNNSRKIKIGDEQYPVAGWYDAMPFVYSTFRTAILTDPYANKYNVCDFYISPKKGMEQQMKREVTELIEQSVPNRYDALPENLYSYLTAEYRSVLPFINLVYIMFAISLLTTVASVYSAISFDTRYRRKEMALRKINGAKPKDICRIFAKTYIIILAICVSIAVPVSIIILISFSQDFGFETSPILGVTIAIAIIALVIFVTVFTKIKDVMSVDPVVYLKD